MNKARFHTRTGVIFGLVGVVLLGVGIALAASTASFMASAGRTEGTVVALIEDRADPEIAYPTVEYTVRGRHYSFESTVGTNPPAYRKGDTVPVAYDRADPSVARIASPGRAFLMPLTFGAAGAVLTPIGAVLLVRSRRSARQRAWLSRNGRQVWAEIARVEREPSVKLNGRQPFVVHATWRDERTGRTHTATSDYIRHDPGPSLRGRSHVRVLHDPDDPDRNLLDPDTAR